MRQLYGCFPFSFFQTSFSNIDISIDILQYIGSGATTKISQALDPDCHLFLFFRWNLSNSSRSLGQQSLKRWVRVRFQSSLTIFTLYLFSITFYFTIKQWKEYWFSPKLKPIFLQNCWLVFIQKRLNCQFSTCRELFSKDVCHLDPCCGNFLVAYLFDYSW